MQFDFEGMGQKKAFDSGIKEDLEGQFGRPLKEILAKEFDIIINRSGKTLQVNARGVATAAPDPQFALISNMLKELIQVVYPPQKGSSSLFAILPEAGAAVGESWQETTETENGASTTTYTLSAATDSTIVVDFKTAASSSATTEIMGMQASTTMKSHIAGQMIADRASGLLKEKTSNIESNGATEAMGNSMPVNAKATIIIKVRRFPLY